MIASDFLSNFSEIEIAFTVYIIVISLISFVVVGLDKSKAKKGDWRVREATLIVLSFLGGAIGVLIGMVFFNHKTKKKKFYIGVPAIYILNRIMITIIGVYLNK
ncbi:Uncharacterized membrane protein YsdA, DUF1294 family [Proteiniborus ethanoligenes]|uniref:Uncharacterized membrane protein YsdA, DUF1294 family n=1 Tax=Proteiniborus ethanoligenes TaxID=415015 RepID=A0A1H3PZC3_9FIRM|nr:DUF1294 domain-containing protein [Proteiniborus ethanoligenes]TAH64103.1 MAG: DUF1294 domain-containing protein [Gottschalkiaceae bacterium]SDZ06288.1 Uncharacterized membrane protein YsdA, DUF1294 family [Proteiniborus ethanoligenes]